MKHKNLGLYIPREKLNTKNLEEALNIFLEELKVKCVRFEVGLFEEDGIVNFGIVLRNMLHLREPIREAYSMLSKHSDVCVVGKRVPVSFIGTPYSDWYLWKDRSGVPEDMRFDEEV